MTIRKVIDDLAELKPHQYTESQITDWLSTLDGQIFQEVVSWHENTNATGDGDMVDPTPYEAVAGDGEEPAAAPDVTLIVPEPYSNLYLFYVAAQADYWNGEITRYNNSMALYNARLSEFSAWYNRKYTPKQPTQYEI